MVDTATFTAVDLSKLPAPLVIEALSFEEIYSQMAGSLQALIGDSAFDALVESDPAIKVLQVAAYRELGIRARINDAARAVMPAYATGADLDHLAALLGITRLVITEADEETGSTAIYESDDDFRSRLVLAPEGYSVAGPEGAYIFHARSADGDVLDASATSPSPGEVVVTILSRTGDGTAPDDLIDLVAAHVSDDARRPLTDNVTVQGAQIVGYAVHAEITTFAGPDGSIVLDDARRRLDSYIERSHRIGLDVTRAGLFGALVTEGVQNVNLITPAADVVISRTQASHCTGINVTHAGVGE